MQCQSVKHKPLKSVLFVFCIYFTAIALSISAFSVDIDGDNNISEWEDSVIHVLLDGESNSGVNYGVVKYLIDNDDSALYLCFMFIDPLLEKDNSAVGLDIKVDDSDSFRLTALNSPAFYDSDKYCFDGALTVDENNGATSEIRVGFKQGIPVEISASVRFIDASGNMSNIYNFIIINVDYTETEPLVISKENDDGNEQKTEKSDKSTTRKTKITTQRTKATTDSPSEKRTTRKRRVTTTAKEKTTQFYIATSPPYSYVRKTKIATKASTTKSSSTTAKKATKTTKKPSDKIYYYEKDVVISHVYVTEPVSQVISGSHSDILTSEIRSTDETKLTESGASETENILNSSFSNSSGTKYKVLIVTSCALAFGATAAAATRSVKVKNKDDNPEQQ